MQAVRSRRQAAAVLARMVVDDDEVDTLTKKNAYTGGSKLDAMEEEQLQEMNVIDHVDGSEFGSRAIRKEDVVRDAGQPGRGEAKGDGRGESSKREERGRIRGVAFLLGLARQL